MISLKNQKIILGVTGGIAAYKSAELIRGLRALGAEVRVVMTASANKFITPLTLQALSHNPVRQSLFDEQAEAAMSHIELARWADLILIAPASADCMAHLAHGYAKDLLTTLCLATSAPILIAPAMNQFMWSNAATQANYQTLLHRGFYFVGPDEGEQACGDVGLGRLADISQIIEAVLQLQQKKYLDKLNVLITAGPTQEAIDPVRYISNHSSGKMGFALAKAAALAGAKVTLISGPVDKLLQQTLPQNVQCINVVSAQEMYDAVMKLAPEYNIFIASAAVADYRCKNISTHKLKKQEENMTLILEKNPDILNSVAALPRAPFTVGFAAETKEVIEHARTKLQNKKIDVIIANQVGHEECAFNNEKNTVTVISNKLQKTFPSMLKSQLARELIQFIAEIYYAKNSTQNFK